MNEFTNFLIHQNLTKNTISAYQTALTMFNEVFVEVNKENLLAFKALLVDKYKGKTINLRIQGINKYLEFLKKAGKTI